MEEKTVIDMTNEMKNRYPCDRYLKVKVGENWYEMMITECKKELKEGKSHETLIISEHLVAIAKFEGDC